MKKLMLLPVLSLALVLASCGTPAVVDPLTLSFTGRGAISNAADVPVTAATPLTAYNRATKAYDTVGTLNADKTVNITITPAQAQAGYIPLSSYQSSLISSDCTGTLTTLGSGSFYYFNTAHAKIGTTDYPLFMYTYNTNTDSTRSYTGNIYIYSSAAGSVTGTLSCPNNTTPITWNLNLKSGWNHVVRTYTYNSTTKTSSNSTYTTIDTSNIYSDPWLY